MSFLMGYVAGMATSSSRNNSRHNFEEERLKTKCKELEQQIKHLQEQLEIATKALKEYAEEGNWRTATTTINTDYFEYECSMYNLKDNGFEEAQKALTKMEGVK